jgi:hypothetical protein
MIVGGFAGQLSDSGERITLRRPGTPPIGEPPVAVHLTEDEVVYDDRGAWPATADGAGNSLQRRGAVLFGNQAPAWHAASPSPGTVDFSGHPNGDLTGDFVVDATDVDILFDEVRRSPSVTYYDLNADDLVNPEDVTWLIQNTLGTFPGDANLDGSVDADDFNVWRSNQFQRCQGWATGDFNGDGITDGSDFNIWNSNRFQAAAADREDAWNNHGETKPAEPRAALRIPRHAPAIFGDVWVVWVSPRATDTELIRSGENAVSDDSRPMERVEVAQRAFARFARRYALSAHDPCAKPRDDDAVRLAGLDGWFANVAGRP